MDERLEERLAGGRVAGLDYLTDVGLEGAQVLIAEPRRGLAVINRELLAPGFQAGEALAQLLDPLAAGPLRHRASLEGAEVALERGVCPAHLGVYPLELCLALGALGAQGGAGTGNAVATPYSSRAHRDRTR